MGAKPFPLFTLRERRTAEAPRPTGMNGGNRPLRLPMPEFAELTAIADERFHAYLEALGGATPRHDVHFSPRITESWALIYYQRRLVRLSPYLFLLDASELKHGTHWRELDATLRHEAAHAAHFATTGQTAHDPGFHALLGLLGVRANGRCDLGPENAAFRYVYGCPTCRAPTRRRVPLRGRWSCGACAPGRYEPTRQIVLMADLGSPFARLQGERLHLVREAIAEARAAAPITAESRGDAEAARRLDHAAP